MENVKNNEEDVKTVLALLYLKHEKLEKMLEITKSTPLSGNEDSIDDYINMIDKRQVVLNEVMEIEQMLAKTSLSHVWQEKNDKFDKEAKLISLKTKDVVSQILLCDKENDSIRQSMMDGLKKNLKEINTTKNVNSYYQYDITANNISYFDKQK